MPHDGQTQGPRGWPNILGLLRGTNLRLTGKAGATAGAGLAGGTTSGAPTSGQFDAGEAVIGQDGSLWICTVAGSPGTFVKAGGTSQLDYVEGTSNVSVSGTTEATATTLVTGSAVAYDGATAVMIECFFPYAYMPSGHQLTFVLYDGSSSIGQIGLALAQFADLYVPVGLKRRLTPSAATHTYSIRVFKDAGTPSVAMGAGGSGNLMPGFIRITTA